MATHGDHVAARNRFVYYPDHLVRMPGPYAHSGILTNIFRNLPPLITEPIFKGVIGSLLAEPTVDTRGKHVEDESVGDFVTRRFGPTIADNMLSALFHGIYAGDIYKLSARTLLAKLWYMETRDPAGSGVMPEVFELMIKNEQICSGSDARLLAEDVTSETSLALFRNIAQQSVYTFTEGIGQLTSNLERALLESPNVRIAKENAVSQIARDKQSSKISITSNGDLETKKYDYVISSLGPTALGDDPRRNIFLGPQEIRDATTVMVVNLYYSNPNLTDPHHGFGYLIPQSVPMDQNPERALGVIFASETSGPRNPAITSDSTTTHPLPIDLSAQWATNHQDTAPGTKLTVMMGGHWWSDWSPSDIPSPETAIEMAKSLLARHMKIFDEPVLAKARLQKDAIPQYRVGYRNAMASVHRDLEAFHGRLRVAGPAWQGGVGVNDCVRRAWEIVDDLDGGEEEEENRFEGGTWKTGLEHFTKEEEWFKVFRKEGKLVIEKETQS